MVLIYRQIKRENCCVLKYAKCIALFLISQSVLIYDLALTRVQSNIKEICQSNGVDILQWLVLPVRFWSCDMIAVFVPQALSCIRWFMFWVICRAFSLRWFSGSDSLSYSVPVPISVPVSIPAPIPTPDSWFSRRHNLATWLPCDKARRSRSAVFC